MMSFNQNGMPMSLPTGATPGMPGMSAPFMAGMGNPFGGADGAMHSAGAIRRGGGGRFSGMRSGPYDRNMRGGPRGGGGGGMGMRNASMLGMGYLAQGGGGGGGKWGDGLGGGMAMGPREAVAGRSIKSYEDLDAAPGGAGGGGAVAAAQAGQDAELDY